MPEQVSIPVQTANVVPPKPPTSIAAGVNAAVGRTLAVPKGLVQGNTKNLGSGYFHAVLYSETSARKTSTAAQFDSPENTRIIVTRRPEQLLPLRDLGYEYALCPDAASLRFALQRPEQLWPDWAARSTKTLVLDDGTEAVNMLLDEAGTIDGKEVKDRRRSYMEAGAELRDLLKLTLAKPMNFIMVALAKVKENNITNADTVGPDLPPSMLNMVTTEFEYVLYIKKANYKLLTEDDRFVFTDIDPQTQKEKTYTRSVFAKTKYPLSFVGKGVVAREEALDLRAFWAKVRKATEVGK